MSQKRDPQQWLAQRTGRTISTATAATFKAESEGRSVDGVNSLVHSGSGPSLGPGGRKLKTVDKGSLFGDDDDDDPAAKRRRAKEYGEDADMDEMLYEDDFADDDDKVEQDGEDEEAKEQEVCLSTFMLSHSLTCVHRSVKRKSRSPLIRQEKVTWTTTMKTMTTS